MLQGLLLLSSQGVRAYSWHKGQLTFEEEFTETASGLTSFQSYLNSHRAVPFRLLADLPDESFRLEAIPPTRGADRHAVIERRLAQMANTSPYTCAVSLGKQHDGRGNERLILAALTRSSHIAPWLDLCCEAGALIQQITSPPFLLSQLTQSLGLHHGRHLLFTLGFGGLRQTHFEDGQLQFSRLVANKPADTATTCIEEAHKVRHYLGDGGLLKPPAETQFHALLAPQEIPAFEARCLAENNLSMRIANLSQLEADHGISSGHPDNSHCDPLLLHLMAKGLSPAQFAPAPVLSPYRLRQWRHKLTIAAMVSVGSCLIAAVAYGFHALMLSTETEALLVKNQEARQQYQALLQTLPPMPAQAAEIRDLNASLLALQRESYFPEVTYRLLSHALDQVPEIEVDRIEWRLVTTSDHSPPRQAGNGGNSPVQPSRMVAVATLDLRVAEIGTERMQTSSVETLAAALRRYPDTEVEVIPVSAPSTTSPSPAPEERFSLRLLHGGH
ncbi:MAG TPA: hypothetical protein VFW68_04425 [Rhodocyclaceae bacterium]|nr:hypothetical protein [Rhodocyclaceae bacterium]